MISYKYREKQVARSYTWFYRGFGSRIKIDRYFGISEIAQNQAIGYDLSRLSWRGTYAIRAFSWRNAFSNPSVRLRVEQLQASK
ncbi:hypothetical protein FACS1894211_05290 [Clostridia bacterium]|nr:hypothetical protein FACS1894211_05290 [Clostridia bacterium]